jgi:hypothetical protein
MTPMHPMTIHGVAQVIETQYPTADRVTLMWVDKKVHPVFYI